MKPERTMISIPAAVSRRNTVFAGLFVVIFFDTKAVTGHSHFDMVTKRRLKNLIGQAIDCPGKCLEVCTFRLVFTTPASDHIAALLDIFVLFIFWRFPDQGIHVMDSKLTFIT